jgi:hypothetical protein
MASTARTGVRRTGIPVRDSHPEHASCTVDSLPKSQANASFPRSPLRGRDGAWPSVSQGRSGQERKSTTPPTLLRQSSATVPRATPRLRRSLFLAFHFAQDICNMPSPLFIGLPSTVQKHSETRHRFAQARDIATIRFPMVMDSGLVLVTSSRVKARGRALPVATFGVPGIADPGGRIGSASIDGYIR